MILLIYEIALAKNLEIALANNLEIALANNLKIALLIYSSNNLSLSITLAINLETIRWYL